MATKAPLTDPIDTKNNNGKPSMKLFNNSLIMGVDDEEVVEDVEGQFFPKIPKNT
ncbi:MAG: hypothetical protein ACW981_20975 [Candidatus Hodarchaeales archaeon]|jgi:hypothetical protein